VKILNHLRLFGLIILLTFAVISIGYSLSKEDQFEGQVAIEIGRVASISNFKKIATLKKISKHVWQLFELDDTILLEGKEALVEELRAGYGTSERPSKYGYVFSVTSKASGLIVVRVRASSAINVENLLKQIASDVQNAHGLIYSQYLSALKKSLETVQGLIDEVEDETSQLIRELPTKQSVGQTLLLQYRADLLTQRDQLNFLSLPIISKPTEIVGEFIIGTEPVEPNIVKHLLMFLILGLAVAITLPLAWGFWLSHRS
jgi:hypothetical protein